MKAELYALTVHPDSEVELVRYDSDRRVVLTLDFRRRIGHGTGEPITLAEGAYTGYRPIEREFAVYRALLRLLSRGVEARAIDYIDALRILRATGLTDYPFCRKHPSLAFQFGCNLCRLEAEGAA